MEREPDIMRFFSYSHLPAHLQEMSKKFNVLAYYVMDNTPAGAEQSTALRKLLEGKDAAVRAKL